MGGGYGDIAIGGGCLKCIGGDWPGWAYMGGGVLDRVTHQITAATGPQHTTHRPIKTPQSSGERDDDTASNVTVYWTLAGRARFGL